MKIVLTGFMGTGKTAVGCRLAERLGLTFTDLDRVIEGAAGMKVAEIFASEGEPGFRRRERELIATLANRRDCVIATGGGAVLDAENVQHLKTGGIIICLRAEPGVILQRIGTDARRPLLQGPERLAKIRELLDHRAPAYAKADLCIDTSTSHVEEIVDRIVGYLGLRPVSPVETD
ncbi:MAG TPA: shikimate kinase [Candidatus Methylomirabilis sp.]|nr:shikimate kinase [Candidatus Methylomirabilis sp.]